MQTLNQRDPKWSGIKLGTSSVTIGSHGCTITCIAMACDLTPDDVNSRLLKVNGYANTNLVIWSKINEAIPTLSNGTRYYSYDNDKVKQAIDKNGFCLVEVDGARIGASRHWCLYIGGGQMIDPWYGTQKATSYYPAVGFTVIDKLVPTTSPTEKELAECNLHKTNLQNQVNGLLKDIESLKGELSEEKNKSATLNGKVQELTKQNEGLSSELGSTRSELEIALQSAKLAKEALQKELSDQLDWAKVAEDEQEVHSLTKDTLSTFLWDIEDTLKLGHPSDDMPTRISVAQEAVGKLHQTITSHEQRIKELETLSKPVADLTVRELVLQLVKSIFGR